MMDGMMSYFYLSTTSEGKGGRRGGSVTIAAAMSTASWPTDPKASKILHCTNLSKLKDPSAPKLLIFPP